MATKKATTLLPEVTGYDTELRFYATRYKQGGRVVYSLDLSLEQVKALINKPDPKVLTPGNRAIREIHAQSFGKYLREHEGWVAPAMILRAPATYDFEVMTSIEGAEFGILSIPRTAASDIRILDGQHRTLGIYLARETLDADLDKARSVLASAKRQDPTGAGVAEAQKRVNDLLKQRERLANERISLQIYVEDDPAEYKQMFFDIADNALGITSSVKARFDARKVVNRSLEEVLLHPLLNQRVDMEADRIGRGSPYLMGAKHVAEIIKSVIVGLDGRVSRRQDLEWKEADVAAKACRFLDMIVEAFPPLKAIVLGQLLPDNLRKTSLLGSVLMFRLLAGAYWELTTNHAFTDAMVEEYFAKLAPHMEGPVYEGSIWLEHMPSGSFQDGAMGPSGRRQDLKATKNTLVAWVLDREKFLDEPPAPRPVKEEDWVDPEYGAGYTALGLEIPQN